MLSKAGKLSRAEQKALRPIQILDAAFEEFVANGFSATRVEDIADRIGVTKGTIYVYFPTKEELFTAMIDHISVPLEDLLQDSGKLTGTCSERLQSLLLLFYENVSNDRRTRELMRFVISEGSRLPQAIYAHHSKFVEPLASLTQSLLDEGIAKGEFRNAPAALASVVVAPVIAIIVEALTFSRSVDDDMPSYIKAHLDLIMKGLTPDRT